MGPTLDSREALTTKVWSIEYDLDTLKAIGDSATAGLQAVRGGGVVVGGLLLGVYDGSSLHIGGFEPLPGEASSTGSFSFTERDEAALAKRIRYHESRAARGSGQQVLGWYHSHAQKGLGLSAEELGTLYQYFPEPWQVGLVLRPSPHGGAQAEFFFKEPAEIAAPVPSTSMALTVRPEREVQAERPDSHWVRDVGKRAIPWGAWTVMGCLALAALGTLLLLRLNYLPPGGQPLTKASTQLVLPLEAVSKNGAIEIHWNPAMLGQAKQGQLTIRDGESEKRLALTAAMLRLGKATYSSKSDVTGFRLLVEKADGNKAEGSTTYVAPGTPSGQNVEAALPPQPIEPPAVQQPAPAVDDTPPEKKSRRQLARERRAEERAEKERLAKERDAVAKGRPAPPAKTPAVFIPPVKQQVATGSPSIAAPSSVIAQGVPHSAPGFALPQIASAPPPPAPVAPTTEPPRPALAGKWALKPGALSRSPLIPQFITINMVDTNGWIQGTLEAQHRSGLKSVFKRERTSFSFGGKVVNGKARFPWTSGEGEHGEIEFLRVQDSPNSFEVIWHGLDHKRVFDEVVRKVQLSTDLKNGEPRGLP